MPTFNFLKKTQTALGHLKRTTDDVVFVGSETSGHRVTWDEFVTLADKEYDTVDDVRPFTIGLVIVFSDTFVLPWSVPHQLTAHWTEALEHLVYGD